ncbi:hypothetical protein LSH36_536g01034 [Paralvinella palmiformis]|uniref:Uncharacterized protein n=1 Tax=Paralvinella palmiformis TaxID=53620 RepID=A0AAD9J8P1_9ANNE|nr:hypothetical protein LSH36_536g01034 [Paralvinella palmiformis]
MAKPKMTCIKGAMCIVCLLSMMIFYISVETFDDVMDSHMVRDEPVIETFSNDTFPRIIHQVWLGYDRKDPPDSWRNATQHSIGNNPDFSYRCWSNGDVIDLLTSHYRWFLPIYHSYPYDVERADAARYFIILHYGGIYLDMDEVSVVSITDIINDKKLQRYQCMLPQGTPSGITNYVILCKKDSRFMHHVTSNLARSKGWYGIPYATVMWSTGPRFISRVYDSYWEKDSLFIMSGSEVSKNFRCLFGQSWFRIDGVIIHLIVYPFIRMGVSWIYSTVFLISMLTFLALFIWRKKTYIADTPSPVL